MHNNLSRAVTVCIVNIHNMTSRAIIIDKCGNGDCVNMVFCLLIMFFHPLWLFHFLHIFFEVASMGLIIPCLLATGCKYIVSSILYPCQKRGRREKKQKSKWWNMLRPCSRGFDCTTLPCWTLESCLMLS